MKKTVYFALISLLVGAALACQLPLGPADPQPAISPSATWTLLPDPTERAAEPVETAEPGTSPVAPESSATAGEGSLFGPTDTPTVGVPAVDCPNAPPARLIVGESARVTFTDGLPLRVRQAPVVADGNIVAQLGEGTVFDVTAGPECSPIPGSTDTFLFWEIFVPSLGISGWAAEGDLSSYYIEPWNE
jgi:hypothetical protein